MKQNIVSPLLLIISFFGCLFVYTKLFGAIPFSVNSNVTNKTDVFTVSGEGKVAVKPDIAYVSVGIESSGATVKEVQANINSVMDKVITGIKGIGVNVEDVKTTSYSINPTYDWTSGRQRITGYSASTNLRVKVKDIDKVNEVIDSSTNNGANQVGSITFDVEDKEKIKDSARKDAVAEAKRKAEAAAGIAGFKLGKIINYSESGDNYYPPMPYARGEMALDAASAAPKTDIQTGSSEITITVSLSYQIE